MTSVSAASFSGAELAAESIAAAFGAGLATTTQVAATVPLPTTLAGTTVKVRDAAGTARIAAVAPGLFTANASGQGVAAVVALRFKPDGTQVNEPVAEFSQAQNRFVAKPIDLGPDGELVFLILFGTGFRNRSSLSAVSASVGGAPVESLFAGAQGDFVGLDQANIGPLPLIAKAEKYFSRRPPFPPHFAHVANETQN